MKNLPHFDIYFNETVATIIIIATVVLLRMVSAKLIKRYAKSSEILENRTNLVIKYTFLVLNSLGTVALIIVWGVKTDYIFATLSTMLTVIGVAFFAQWSLLSNITSGIILLFSFPFKIGDVILIHDKDFPIEGEIEDIRAFHTHLRTKEGRIITYPNNLLLQKGISILPGFHEDREFTD
jgi:small-conductance mechanosensitive channel